MKKPLNKLFLLFVIFSFPLFAMEFEKIVFGNDEISINVPKEWELLSNSLTKEINKFSAEILNKNSYPSYNKTTLLAINARPSPANAVIRLNILAPLDYTQADLANMTKEELAQVSLEIREMFMKTMHKEFKKLGLEPLMVYDTKIIKNNAKYAMLITYLRKGSNDSIWLVSQFKFPNDKKGYLIELTLSQNLEKSDFYNPILMQVLKSLKF